MTGVLTLAWLHYLAIMLLAAALVAEHLLFTPRPERATARKLVVVDLVYGMSLLVALATMRAPAICCSRPWLHVQE